MKQKTRQSKETDKKCRCGGKLSYQSRFKEYFCTTCGVDYKKL